MNPCRILVVEDEGIVAMDIQERLVSMGYQVVGHAASGEQALALAEEQRPDLVLMDIRLRGEMDGISVAEEIRRRFHEPVIFLTAYSEDTTVERAKLAEPYGYILKPFDDRELKSTIEIALYKHRAEEEIRRLNRLYDVLSQVNQAVVRIQSREELLPTICRLVVERGAVDLAWIGWLDPATSRIRSVAHFGNRSEMLSDADLYADGRPEGQGAHGRAIREGKPFVCNECVDNVCLYPSAQSPARFGFKSCGSFPLRFQDQVRGVLNICVAEPGFFREREIELLKEVAVDISFALDKIEDYNQRERLGEQLRRQSDFLETLMEAMPYPVFFKDAQLRYLGCNAAFEQFVGIERDQLIGKTVYEFWPHDLADVYQRADRELLASTAPQIYEGVMQAIDGVRYNVLVHKAVFRNPDGGMGGIIGAMEDITERKKAEDTLNKANRSLRVLSDCNQALIRAVDEEDLNRQVCRIVVEGGGYCLAWVGYVGDDDDARHVRAVAREWGDEEHKQAAHAAAITLPLSADSRVFGTLNIYSAEPCAFGEEEVKLLTELADDLAYGITALRTRVERERALDALKESEARYRTLVEQMPAIIYKAALDEHSTTTYISPQVEPLLGYSQAEYGKDPDLRLERLHPEDRDRVLDHLAMSRATGEPLAVEYRMLDRNESVHWFRDEAVIVRDDAGKPLFLQGIMLDITERKQAEDTLRERELYYRSLLSDLQEDILVIDSGYRIVDASKDFLPVVGRSREDVIGRTCYTILHGYQEPCDRLGMKCMLREVLATGEHCSSRHEHAKGGGAKVWVDVLLSSLKDHLGNTTHLIETVRDVTHEAQLERQLRQAQKMEALGTLAGGIAHDFNNILGIILGYTELALLETPREAPANNQLGQVVKASYRARDLVQQILAFSRQREQERKPLQIGPIVKEALKLLRASLPSTIDIRQDVQIGRKDGDVVLADPTQIHQVLMNLCTNAGHAMLEKGGVLEVTLSDADADFKEAVAIPELHPGPYIKLTVSDTGHGIDPGILDRIFDPYFTTKMAGEGTGLGLAVVHGIVISHGGAITVESEPGKGSSFHVFLPAIENEPSMEEKGILPLPAARNETILFVDDETALVNFGRQALEHFGYKVVTASNGKEALEIFRTAPNKFDLVITDQTMPHLTGTELAEEILRINPGIPIILCTGFDRAITPAKAAAMGISALLMKPLGLYEAAGVIRRVLDDEEPPVELRT